MKISPLAAGTGVPAQSDSSLGRTADSAKLAKAKAIASGQAPADVPRETTGDPQADRAMRDVKKIKMRTQVSTNRHDQVPVEVEAAAAELPTPDINEPAKETEETRPISPEMAALIKAKRALQVKERELAQREEAIKAQSPAVNMEDYISKADLKANPMKVFDAGVTYDGLTEALMNNPINPEIQTLKADIKALKEELNGQLSTRDQQAEQQVLANIESNIRDLTADGEQFEAIRQARAQKKVVELIHKTWKKTGEVLSDSDAAELVENQLIEDNLPFARIKKVQSRITPAPETRPEQIPAPQKPNTKIMRTLTNRDTATQGPQDRRARALAAWNGTLKRG